jgi:hypothetical protein
MKNTNIEKSLSIIIGSLNINFNREKPRSVPGSEWQKISLVPVEALVQPSSDMSKSDFRILCSGRVKLDKYAERLEESGLLYCFEE